MKSTRRKKYVEFEMTGYHGLDKNLKKAQNILKEAKVTRAKGGIPDREAYARRLMKYVEAINKLAPIWERKHVKGAKKNTDKFEAARAYALKTIWEVFQMVQVSIDASTLGELSEADPELDTAAMFITSYGQKNPNIDYDPQRDTSPGARDAVIVSYEELIEKNSDDEDFQIENLIEHGNAGTPKDGFEDEEVQGFWRDPRDLKWAKLSGGNH